MVADLLSEYRCEWEPSWSKHGDYSVCACGNTTEVGVSEPPLMLCPTKVAALLEERDRALIQEELATVNLALASKIDKTVYDMLCSLAADLAVAREGGAERRWREVTGEGVSVTGWIQGEPSKHARIKWGTDHHFECQVRYRSKWKDVEA